MLLISVVSFVAFQLPFLSGFVEFHLTCVQLRFCPMGNMFIRECNLFFSLILVFNVLNCLSLGDIGCSFCPWPTCGSWWKLGPGGLRRGPGRPEHSGVPPCWPPLPRREAHGSAPSRPQGVSQGPSRDVGAAGTSPVVAPPSARALGFFSKRT